MLTLPICPANDVQRLAVPSLPLPVGCGLFMVKTAVYLSQGRVLDFVQGDMPYFRRRTVLEILQTRLL